MLLIPLLLLLTAAAAFYFLKDEFPDGIDTPIVITGGSLKLYSTRRLPQAMMWKTTKADFTQEAGKQGYPLNGARQQLHDTNQIV